MTTSLTLTTVAADQSQHALYEPADRLLTAPMSRFQILAVTVIFLLCCLDGFDALAISFAAPALSAEWSIGKAQIGCALSAGLIGMALGSVIASFGWRAIFVVASAAGLIMIYLVWRFLPEPFATIVASSGRNRLARANDYLKRCGHPPVTELPVERQPMIVGVRIDTAVQFHRQLLQVLDTPACLLTLAEIEATTLISERSWLEEYQIIGIPGSLAGSWSIAGKCGETQIIELVGHHGESWIFCETVKELYSVLSRRCIHALFHPDQAHQLPEGERGGRPRGAERATQAAHHHAEW